MLPANVVNRAESVADGQVRVWFLCPLCGQESIASVDPKPGAAFYRLLCVRGPYERGCGFVRVKLDSWDILNATLEGEAEKERFDLAQTAVQPLLEKWRRDAHTFAPSCSHVWISHPPVVTDDFKMQTLQRCSRCRLKRVLVRDVYT